MDELEFKILKMVLDKHPSKNLEDQITSLQVVRREHTGAGLYVYFNSHENANLKPVLNTKRINGPLIESSKLQHGAGCIVWLDEGIIDFVEIFSYSDTYPTDNYTYELKWV